MGKTKFSLVFLLILIFSMTLIHPVFANGEIEFKFNKSEYRKDDLIEGQGRLDLNGVKSKDITYTVEDKDGNSIYKIGQDKIDDRGEFKISFRLPRNISEGNYYLRINLGGEHKEYEIKVTDGIIDREREETPSKPEKPGGLERPNKPEVKPNKPEKREVSFEDIKNHWAKKEIEDLIARKIVNGVNEKEFKPNKNITRAEFLKLMVEALDLELVEGKKDYVDVREGDWYYDYVATGKKANLINGKTKDSFSPNDDISREEMAVIISRSMKGEEKIGDKSNFKDRDKISKWAMESVDYIYSLKIIQGDKFNNFKPHQSATRAEASVMIWRYLNIN